MASDHVVVLVAEQLAPALRAADHAAAVLDLLEFLEHHGGSDATQDREIVAYLLEDARRC